MHALWCDLTPCTWCKWWCAQDTSVGPSVQDWKLPPRVAEESSAMLLSKCGGEEGKEPTTEYILDIACQKLLSLETNIERRYLKPPFAKK